MFGPGNSPCTHVAVPLHACLHAPQLSGASKLVVAPGRGSASQSPRSGARDGGAAAIVRRAGRFRGRPRDVSGRRLPPAVLGGVRNVRGRVFTDARGHHESTEHQRDRPNAEPKPWGQAGRSLLGGGRLEVPPGGGPSVPAVCQFIITKRSSTIRKGHAKGVGNDVVRARSRCSSVGHSCDSVADAGSVVARTT